MNMQIYELSFYFQNSITSNTLPIFSTPAKRYNQDFSNHEPGKAAQIVVLDAQGKLVHQQTAEGWGNQSARIDVADLAQGMYFVKIKIRHQVVSGQFVVN